MSLVINGTTFDGIADGSGNQSAWRPTGITLGEQKVGVTLVAANGTRNRVERGVNKRVWTIVWDKTNNATMLTIRTIARLATTFAFVDLSAASYTVQTEDAFDPAYAFTDQGGALYWNVTLVLYEV